MAHPHTRRSRTQRTWSSSRQRTDMTQGEASGGGIGGVARARSGCPLAPPLIWARRTAGGAARRLGAAWGDECRMRVAGDEALGSWDTWGRRRVARGGGAACLGEGRVRAPGCTWG